MALADARAIEVRREPHPPEVHSLFSSPIVREGKDFGEAVASPLLLRLGHVYRATSDRRRVRFYRPRTPHPA